MSLHPEELPKEAKSFTLSLDSIPESQAIVDGHLSKCKDRIEDICEHYTIGGFPVLRHILNMSHDKDELKGLATGLDRLAKIVEVHDQLERKSKTLQTIIDEPSWFAMATADVGLDILDSEIPI